jgi:hypothetical protein
MILTGVGFFEHGGAGVGKKPRNPKYPPTHVYWVARDFPCGQPVGLTSGSVFTERCEP